MTTPRVTVPVEPTEAMIEAGNRALSPWIAPAMHAAEAYRAMLSEAPAPEGGAVSIWSDARNVFVRYAELFAMTERYEEASAIADKAAREIEALATREEAPAEAGERERLIQDLSDAESWRRLPGNENHLATADLFARAISALRAQPPAREDAQPVGWLRAVDEEMVCAHLGVADAEDSFETAKKKLASLIQWNIAVATDPSVGGHPAPDALRKAVEALLLFRAFVQRNVTQWKLGAGDHHHPMWGLVAEALGDGNRIEVASGAEWRFIQPENRRALAALQAEQGAK